MIADRFIRKIWKKRFLTDDHETVDSNLIKILIYLFLRNSRLRNLSWDAAEDDLTFLVSSLPTPLSSPSPPFSLPQLTLVKSHFCIFFLFFTNPPKIYFQQVFIVALEISPDLLVLPFASGAFSYQKSLRVTSLSIQKPVSGQDQNGRIKSRSNRRKAKKFYWHDEKKEKKIS